MDVIDILSPERIQLDVDASSKKRVLECAAGLIAETSVSLSSRAVCDCLIARERLGSTGLGHGVAIPHGRFSGLGETMGAFLKIRDPVEFDAPDGQPVDLVFVLVVPEESTEEHLNVLARLAEFFSAEATRAALRADISPSEVRELLRECDSRA
jgi:PTS system nitrogen regulatory IIA component